MNVDHCINANHAELVVENPDLALFNYFCTKYVKSTISKAPENFTGNIFFEFKIISISQPVQNAQSNLQLLKLNAFLFKVAYDSLLTAMQRHCKSSCKKQNWRLMYANDWNKPNFLFKVTLGEPYRTISILIQLSATLSRIKTNMLQHRHPVPVQ